MWEAIDAAKKEVRFVVYIMKDDAVGRKTLKALTDAARRGVKVTLLYDDAGNITGRSGLTAELRNEPMAEVVCFRPMFRSWLWYVASGFDWLSSPAIRNHRKILVVDGQVAFTGGLNIGNEYAGRDCDSPGMLSGRFRDSLVRVSGPAVQDLADQLAEVVQWAGAAEDRAERLSWADWNRQSIVTRSHASHPADTPQTADPFEPPHVIKDCSGIEVTACNPWLRDYSAQRSLALALRGATDRVFLVTPYFTPPERLLRDVEDAARRGVKVDIMVGGRGSTDPPIMWWVEQRWYRRVLEAGARVFEYTTPGEVMHAKLWSVDGQMGSVGSFNLDLLSDFLLETNVSARDARYARNLERQFQRDSARCRLVTLDELDSRAHDPLKWSVTAACSAILHTARFVLAPNFREDVHF